MACAALAGCASWPTWQDFSSAAVNAARSPNTWVPLAGAALLMVDDQDADLTEWAMREQPVFGDDAASAGDDIEALLAGTYLLTVLTTPGETWSDRGRRLSVGAATVVLEGGVTKGLKRTLRRERPNGRNDFSLPSGHAGRSAALATLTRQNVAMHDWSPAARTAMSIGLRSAESAVAWSRVEAGRHHASDVLVGNGMGHFIASFMNELFLESESNRATVRFTPLEQGGAFTVSMQLP